MADVYKVGRICWSETVVLFKKLNIETKVDIVRSLSGAERMRRYPIAYMNTSRIFGNVWTDGRICSPIVSRGKQAEREANYSAV